MTTTDTANFLSMNGRGGRILHLNITSDRDFKLASDHISYIKCLCIIFSAIYISCLGNTRRKMC